MGHVIGEVLMLILPKGPVKELFLKVVDFGIPTFTINLAIVKFTFGLVFSFNLMAVIFIFLMIYLLSKF